MLPTSAVLKQHEGSISESNARVEQGDGSRTQSTLFFCMILYSCLSVNVVVVLFLCTTTCFFFVRHKSRCSIVVMPLIAGKTNSVSYVMCRRCCALPSYKISLAVVHVLPTTERRA